MPALPPPARLPPRSALASIREEGVAGRAPWSSEKAPLCSMPREASGARRNGGKADQRTVTAAEPVLVETSPEPASVNDNAMFIVTG